MNQSINPIKSILPYKSETTVFFFLGRIAIAFYAVAEKEALCVCVCVSVVNTGCEEDKVRGSHVNIL